VKIKMLFIALVVLLIVSSCASTPNAHLIGVWETETVIPYRWIENSEAGDLEELT
jgi:hypothetical protein